MSASEHLLFVYGTLRRAVGAPAHRLFSAHADFFDDGYVAARLYDLGDYPGLVLSQDGGDRVIGELYTLRTPEPTLTLLDRYEGVAGTRGDAPAQYRRIKVPVTSQNGRVHTAWIYEYLLDVGDRPLVRTGDYLDFLRNSGRHLGLQPDV